MSTVSKTRMTSHKSYKISACLFLKGLGRQNSHSKVDTDLCGVLEYTIKLVFQTRGRDVLLEKAYWTGELSFWGKNKSSNPFTLIPVNTNSIWTKILNVKKSCYLNP